MMISSLLFSLWLGATVVQESKISTEFQLYAPPNAMNGNRYSAVVITAQAGSAASPCIVDLVDVADDGDSDDSVSASLVKGQSLVRYIKDGTVNDDAGGKWDGDYFRVHASLPVSVYEVTDSDWAHDWAPATNGTLRGNEFYLYANRIGSSARDINVFAYESGTRVELYDITQTALTGSGTTTVVSTEGTLVMSADMDVGCDLIWCLGLGRDLLPAGRTFRLVATHPVTTLFGALSSLANTGGVRDAAGFVPGQSGSAGDNFFFFAIPHDPGLENEQELRVISFDDYVQVTLWGRMNGAGNWTVIKTANLNALDTMDNVGGPYELYRLQSLGGRVAVYEANWMETGAIGTSDELDFAPGIIAEDGTQTTVAYVGPPGTETATTIAGTYSHIYVYAVEATDIRVVDADTAGSILNETRSIAAGGYADVRIDSTTYTSMRSSGRRPYVRLTASHPVAVAVSNWNDNWMGYVTAVLPRNPVVTLSSPTSASEGGAVTISGTIQNTTGTSLPNVTATLVLPQGFTYVSSAEGPTVTTGATSTTLTYALGTLEPNATSTVSADVLAPADAAGRANTLSLVASSPAGISPSAAAGGDAAIIVVQSAQLVLQTLTATNGDASVQLNWQEASPSAQQIAISVQRSGSVSGPYVTIGTVQSLGTTPLTQRTYTDTAVTNLSTYYYRLVGADGTQAGPIVAQPRDTTPPPVPTLGLGVGDRVLTVTLGSSNQDANRYRIEWSVNGTSYTTSTVNVSAGPTYTIPSLTNGTSYFVRAVAIDAVSNTSAYTPIASAAPSATTDTLTSSVLFFEDMIGAGDNDWDYNDFVVNMQVTEARSAAGLLSTTLDFEPLARGASYVHRLHVRIPSSGAYTATIRQFTAANPAVAASTQVVTGEGEVDVVVYNDTRTALPPADRAFTNTTAAQSVFAAGTTAQVTIVWTGGSSTTTAAPYDTYLELPYLIAPNTIHRSAFGAQRERCDHAGPLIGLDLPFVVEQTSAQGYWSREGAPAWNEFPSFAASLMTQSDWWTVPQSSGAQWSRAKQ